MSECTKNALKTIGREPLIALYNSCTVSKRMLYEAKADLNDMSRSLDAMIEPLLARRSALESIVNATFESLRLIPSDVVAMCPQLGEINAQTNIAVSIPYRNAMDSLDQINRMLSIQAETTHEISRIDVAIQFFESLQADISDLLLQS